MARVTERWIDRTLIRGRSARRVFEIDNGPTNEDEALTALFTETGVGDGVEHPLDPSLTVSPGTIEAVPVVPGFYRVSVPYESNTNVIGGDTTALFAKKWQVLPTEIIAAEVDADTTYDGEPALTTSDVAFDEPLKRRVNWYRFRLRRYESGTDLLSKNLAYQGRWNSDAVTLPRYGSASAKQLLIISIAQVEAQQQGVSNGVLVEYTLEARPTRSVVFDGGSAVVIHGWHTRRLDRATKALVEDGSLSYSAPILNSSPPYTPVDEPVLIDGKGWPLRPDGYIVRTRDGTTASPPSPPAPGAGMTRESTSRAVFLNFDCTEGPIAFSGLSFGANL